MAPETVRCSRERPEYRATYRGDAALARCIRDPQMQTPGGRRVAEIGPGRFDFGDGAAIVLDDGWTLRGAGVDQTTLYASRPTTSIFRTGFHSLIQVRGRDVTLSGFTFDGACGNGPSPGNDCDLLPDHSLLGIVVACGLGTTAPAPCDVDGLLVEDLRVLRVKTPFLATSTPAADERPGLFANFLDFGWTIRRFQVSGLEDPFRYARIFELGNPMGADISQGPGAGVGGKRRYRLRIEDTRIDARIGRFGGRLAGLLTAALNAGDATLDIEIVDSTLQATQRVVGLGTRTVDRSDGDGGRIRLRCRDSRLIANHPELRDPARASTGSGPGMCPHHDAVLQAAENARPGGPHQSRIELRRCPVEVVPWLSLCPEPVAVDLGDSTAEPHATLCVLDTALPAGVRRGETPVPEVQIPVCPAAASRGPVSGDPT